MINNSEQSEMTEEQWGGRPGRIAHDPAFQKLLTFEYARVIYVTIAMFANDATACIDRMVPNISSLVARKHRVTPKCHEGTQCHDQRHGALRKDQALRTKRHL